MTEGEHPQDQIAELYLLLLENSGVATEVFDKMGSRHAYSMRELLAKYMRMGTTLTKAKEDMAALGSKHGEDAVPTHGDFME